MVQALVCVHSVGILHCDVKTGDLIYFVIYVTVKKHAKISGAVPGPKTFMLLQFPLFCF